MLTGVRVFFVISKVLTYLGPHTPFHSPRYRCSYASGLYNLLWFYKTCFCNICVQSLVWVFQYNHCLPATLDDGKNTRLHGEIRNNQPKHLLNWILIVSMTTQGTTLRCQRHNREFHGNHRYMAYLLFGWERWPKTRTSLKFSTC